MAADPEPDEVARSASVSRRHLLGYAGAAAVGATGASAVAVVGFGGDDDRPVATTAPTGSARTPPSAGAPSTGRRAVDGYQGTDYGATPADATAGFRAAVSAAARDGGGVVRVPDGRWALGDALELPANVTLAGQSIVGTILRAAGASTVIAHASNVEGATVENLSIDGAGRAGAGVSDPDGARYCTLRRVRVSRVRGPRVHLQGGRVNRMYVQDLYVSGVGGHGVDVDVDEATSSSSPVSRPATSAETQEPRRTASWCWHARTCARSTSTESVPARSGSGSCPAANTRR